MSCFIDLGINGKDYKKWYFVLISSVSNRNNLIHFTHQTVVIKYTLKDTQRRHHYRFKKKTPAFNLG